MSVYVLTEIFVEKNIIHIEDEQLNSRVYMLTNGILRQYISNTQNLTAQLF